MTDIRWEGRSQRSAPQKRHTAHLRRRARCLPRNPSGWGWGGDKTRCPPGGDCARHAPGHLSCWDGGRHRTQAQPSLRLWGGPEDLNLGALDLGSARNPGPASDSSPRAPWGLSSVDRERAHALSGQTQRTHARVAVFSTTEQGSLNK